MLQLSVERLQGEIGRLGEVRSTRATRSWPSATRRSPSHLDLIQRLQRETVRLGTLMETSTRELTSLRERFAQDESGQLRDRITAMESSKFWKGRTLWFQLKRALGVASKE